MATGARRHGGTRDDAAGPFTAERTHGVALRPENRLIASSEGLGWQSVYMDRHREGPYAGMELAPVVDPAFSYLLGPGCTATRATDGRHAAAAYGPRQFNFAPTDDASRWSTDASLDLLHVYVRRPLLDRCAAEMFDRDPDRVVVLPRFAVLDPLLEQLALGVMRAMQERPPGHALHVDCLAQAMAAHLVQHHSTPTRPARVPKPDGLTDHRLRRLADYIEAHLGCDPSLDAMAEQAGLGPHHLARTFRRAFGEPPHRYLVRRRVERAKGLLRATDLPIAEVALVCGFATQSHLGEAFRRGVGTSPGAYRRGT